MGEVSVVMISQILYVDVLLPIPLNQVFTYVLPSELNPMAQVGSRVVVPLGARKLYTGIVSKVHAEKPKDYATKPIVEVLDSHPILSEMHLRFWNWISSYYLCTSGEVMKAALPSGLKLESETQVGLNTSFDNLDILTEKERVLYYTINDSKTLSLQELEKITGLTRVLPTVQRMVEKGVFFVSEGIKHSYKAKMRSFVRLTDLYSEDEERLHHFLDNSKRAQKQVEILTTYLNLKQALGSSNIQMVSKKELLDRSNSTSTVFQALVVKGILETVEIREDRLQEVDAPLHDKYKLSSVQASALESIRAHFKSKAVCLLHGQTSSGKTEVYIHLMEECIQSGKQVLYLVPEIALTTQLANRLKRVFGHSLGVYHSKFPDNERVELWHKMIELDGYQVILGVRSSIFLPFRNLGLIIVDEEHETSFKQQDPAPRYHARSAAIMLASLYGAKTLLGTATPSMETYCNCLSGKFGLVELKSRHFDMQMPEIITVNTKELRRKKRMKGLFSPLLQEKMEEALQAGEQVILFQNRRGYAPMVECKTCGYVPKCERCDVSLTYHKYLDKLTCHYCGFDRDLPKRCPSCDEGEMKFIGVGTEQIEEEVKLLFPDALIGRMDTDTTRSQKSYEQIINDFDSKRTHILIGTQMVSKGLDFRHVRVVGILNADQMLNFPDFRAHERSFQLMVQVSGRAGRHGERGMVIVQTSNPDQQVLWDVVANDYEGFYQRESTLRKQFSYPPFARLIQIKVKHADAPIVRQAALKLKSMLEPYFKSGLLGPDQPIVARINNSFIQHLLLKIDRAIPASKVNEILLLAQDRLKQDRLYKNVHVIYDVDPY
jgi:primosomal protein N' (replication factor Y) (superfamily II helicase)